MIRLEDVTAGYGDRAVLHGISLDVQERETLALVGPNSAGKSTLLKAMGGLLPLQKGRVLLDGRPLSEWPLPERARRMAWVPSDATLAFSFTVEELVLLGRTPHLAGYRAPRPADRKVAAEMLDLTDLTAQARRPVDGLSSGERQRTLLARAFAQEPRLLLLDEPTAHLDIGHSHAFFRALERLRQTRSLTVVLATHDLELARRFAGQVALVDEGRLRAVGAPAAVLHPEQIRTTFKLP